MRSLSTPSLDPLSAFCLKVPLLTSSNLLRIFSVLFMAVSLCASIPTVMFAADAGHADHGGESGDHDHHHGHQHRHDHPHPQAGDSPGEWSAPWGSLGAYSFLIAGASLVGGWLPGRVKFSHLQFQMLLSVVGGLLLGIGVFHLLTHAVHSLGPGRIDTVALWVMAGIVAMFFLLRAFHVHHHEPDVPLDGEVAAEQAAPQADADHHHHDHGVQCSHDHHATHAPSGRLGWAGLFFGLGVHTLLDGLALGASMQADALHGIAALVGAGVMLGIVLHKPLDSLTITALMINAGCSKRQKWIVNVIYALLCPLGAAAFFLGISTVGTAITEIVGASLAFSAGVFVCIALSDLLPEMEFHSHHRMRLSLCLMAGIVLAWAIQFVEPAHLHG